MHPDVQRSAQEELDCVIGTDRLPELADRDSLPMVSAILWEVLRCVSRCFLLCISQRHTFSRWHPVSPLGTVSSRRLHLRSTNVDHAAIPHKLMEDDEYQGLHIPAGSVVVCNVW